MYILLSGIVPFPGQTSFEILKNVLNMELNFDHPQFVHVSLEAKDLVQRMLTRDVNLRISAREIRDHLWFKFFSDNELTFSGSNTGSNC